MFETKHAGCSRLFRMMTEKNFCKSVGNLQYYLNYIFQNVVLADKAVLDIGCGSRIIAAYAACRGARIVVGLEPEMAGSRSEVISGAKEIVESIDSNSLQIHFLQHTIQDYDSKGLKFDIILMHNSVNHLNEEACKKLHICHKAQEMYISIFRKISHLLNRGGIILILDCSRYNIWPSLRLKNPFCPQIEWEKHQSPKLWCELLGMCGLKHPIIQWTSSKTLRWLGKPLRNRFMAYFFTSHFRLEMCKLD